MRAETAQTSRDGETTLSQGRSLHGCRRMLSLTAVHRYRTSRANSIAAQNESSAMVRFVGSRRTPVVQLRIVR